jgi:hypothetical protein
MTGAEKGIPDWELKLPILLSLLGAFTHLELADRVLPNNGPFNLTVKDNFRKWKSSRPTKKGGPKVFFDKLPTALGCPAHVTGVMLVESNIQQFIEYLPEGERRDAARKILEEGRVADLPARADKLARAIVNAPSAKTATILSRTLSNAFSANFKTMNFHSRAKIESMETGIHAGQINQRHYYLTPDAASTWINLVRAEAYPTYDQCKAGLRALVDGEIWRNIIAAGNHRTVVMLAGGGAPTKDIVLINSLLHSPVLSGKTIDYILIDYSYYMLITSHLWLDEGLAHLGDTARVTVRPVQHDLMNLRECESGLRLSENVVFGLTGGTLGNLNEEQFFESLNSVAHNGDLLILSADTLEDGPLMGIKRELIEKYDHAEMRRFILPAIRAVVTEYDLFESVSSVFKRIAIDLKDAKRAGLSKVERTASVTLSLDVKEKNLVLLSSTRYLASTLISFADKFGWTLLTRTPSPLNAKYVQFLFQRKKVEKRGK